MIFLYKYHTRKFMDYKKFIETESIDKKAELITVKKNITKENVNQKIMTLEYKNGFSKKVAPLYWAIQNENYSAIDYFFQIGAEIKILFNEKDYEFEDCIKNIENIDTLKVLINNGIDFQNIKFNIPYIKLTFEKINLESKKIDFLTYSILVNKKISFIKELIELDIFSDKNEHLSYLKASMISYNNNECLEIIKIFVSKESRQEIINSFAEMSASKICESYKIELLRTFINEFSLNLYEKTSNNVPIIEIIHKFNNNNIKFLAETFKYNSNFSLDNNENIKENLSRELFDAISCGNFKEIKTLLNKGANPNFIGRKESFIECLYSYHNRNCLSKNKKFEIFQLLLDYGLNINAVKNNDILLSKLIEYEENYGNKNFNLINYIVNNNLGDFSQPWALVSLIFYNDFYDIEMIKKLIDKHWDHEGLYNLSNKNMNLLEFIFQQRNNELTNYMIDNYPQVKFTSKNNALFAFAIILSDKNKLNTETIKKAIIHNRENLNDIFWVETENRYQSTILEIFSTSSLKWIFQNDTVDKYIEILKTMFECGINTKYKNIMKNLFKEILFQMLDHNYYKEELISIFFEAGYDPTVKDKKTNKITLTEILFSKKISSPEIKEETIIDIFNYFNNKSNIDFNTDEYLILAAKAGLSKVCKWMVENGADINFKLNNTDDKNILYNAINAHEEVLAERKLETIKILLEADAEVNKIYCLYDENYRILYRTPLMSAVYNGELEVIKLLLDYGANPNQKNNKNLTALYTAINSSHKVLPEKRVEIIKLLLNFGADIEEIIGKDELTPLMVAAYMGKVDSFKFLLNNGANPYKKDRRDNNVPFYAMTIDENSSNSFDSVEENKKEILSILQQEYNFDLKNTITKYRDTFLIMCIRKNLKKIFDYFLELDFDINMANPDGFTPMMVALKFGDRYFVDKLFELNADITTKNSQNKTALTEVLDRNNKEEAIEFIRKILEKDKKILPMNF